MLNLADAPPLATAPTVLGSVIFRFKATLFQIRRGLLNFLLPTVIHLPLIKKGTPQRQLNIQHLIAQSRSPLWTSNLAEERQLQAGKIHNLRVAIRQLNGLHVRPGQVFSFWAQIGKPTRRAGYVAGRELREGCIIASVGGGLCQLSNALYAVALKAGCNIVERHAHSQVVSGSAAELGQDATVFWNYVDLRFSALFAFSIVARLEARPEGDQLVVYLYADEAILPVKRDIKERPIAFSPRQPARHIDNCVTCNQTGCFRHEHPRITAHEKTAYLVNTFSPEFDAHIQASHSEGDVLMLPLDGKRWRKANYAWNTDGFETHEALAFTLVRAYSSRRLADQGAARQRVLLDAQEKLSERYAKKLAFDVGHIVVSQELAPFLWRDGHLAARRVTVLLSRLPISELQRTLDTASKHNPDSKTLVDFRAPEWLAEAEAAVLKYAEKIVTPHACLASLVPHKTTLLPWHTAPVSAVVRAPKKKPCFIFPASTLARKGAYELREALQGIEADVIIFGRELEGENFWHGSTATITHQARNIACLGRATAVVLPAWVEFQPRFLLAAKAQSVPVIATAACGLSDLSGVTIVEAGDVAALRAALVWSATQDV